MSPTLTPILTSLEARVLGVLLEKERTVPDTYPLTLNALVSGCNQKTSRDPVMSVTDSEAQGALDDLKSKSLVIESSGGRVARYTHNFERVYRVPRQASAVLASLMLRGPQTAGELRINTERLYAFSDISSVEAFLQELAERTEGALVTELPRQPGSRENRWAHLLSGAPEYTPSQVDAASDRQPPRAENASALAALEERVARLERELETLKATLEPSAAKDPSTT